MEVVDYAFISIRILADKIEEWLEGDKLMIYNSHYWIGATALEPLNHHEIVVLEKDKNGFFTVRHAKQPEDWLHNQAAYINTPQENDVNSNEICRCLIVSVMMK
jgi:hypothetical protein